MAAALGATETVTVGTGGSGGDFHVPGSDAIPGSNWAPSTVEPSHAGGSFLAGGKTLSGSAANDEHGAPGHSYGGGGTGARSSSDTTNRAGGDGADGVVIVEIHTTF